MLNVFLLGRIEVQHTLRIRPQQVCTFLNAVRKLQVGVDDTDSMSFTRPRFLLIIFRKCNMMLGQDTPRNTGNKHSVDKCVELVGEQVRGGQ